MAQETSNDSTMVDVQLGTLRIIMQGPFDRLSDQLRQEVVDGVALFSGAAREELHDITFKRGCIIFEAKIPQAALEQFFETLIQNDVDQGGEAALALRKFLQQHLVEEISDDRERKVELRTSVAITTSRTAAQQRAPSPATDVATLPDESRIVFVHGYIGDEGTFGAVPSLLEAATRIKSAVYTYPTHRPQSRQFHPHALQRPATRDHRAQHGRAHCAQADRRTEVPC